MKTKWGKKMIWQVVIVVSILWVWGMVRPDDASAVTDACNLLSAAEIEAVFGEKVIYNKVGETNKEVCQMAAGRSFVMVRRFAKKDADTKHANEGIEKAKKMGLKMKEEKYGNTTCWTAIGNSKTPAYTTGCIVDKGGFMVGVDVMAPSEAQLVPSAKVRLLVEKAASRL